jgi:WD40 repeat protein
VGQRSHIGAAARVRANGVHYNAFLSYSRAVDGKLAPALQVALQRFAKPWYRMRALRVFRDDASLSANPALWPSIEEALEASDFFILLASPEAAESRWVGREVEYWRDHKPHDHLLIALAAGEIVWDETRHDFVWERTALPRAIQGIFSDEPRYTDLRWARTDEHVSLSDPRFRSDAADLAAPLHGRPKDEVLGEAVRQHRRTVRVASAAVVLLALLAVAAGLAAVLAVKQRDEARAQRDLATSRYLVSQSLSDLDSDLPRALLLSLEALRFANTAEARGALFTALQHPEPEVVSFLEGHRSRVSSLAFSSDGNWLASGSADDTVVVWDVESRRPLDRRLRASDSVEGVAFAPDGKTLAAGDARGEVVLWDVDRQERIRRMTGDFPAIGRSSPLGLAFSRDGETIASLGSRELFVWDLRGRRRSRDTLPGLEGLQTVALSPDRTIAAAVDAQSKTVLWDVGRGRRLDAPVTKRDDYVTTLAFTSDGRTLALGSRRGILLWDVARGRPLRPPLRDASTGPVTTNVTSLAFSPNGKALAESTGAGITLWTAGDPPLSEKLETDSDVVEMVFNPDGQALASADEKGTITLWDLGERHSATLTPLTFVARLRTPLTQEDETPSGGAHAFALSPDGKTLAVGGGEGTVVLWDVDRRRPLDRPLRGHSSSVEALAFSPDGETLASGADNDAIIVWDVERRRPLGPPLTGDDLFLRSLAFSPDGKTLASSSWGNTIVLWDVERRRRLEPPLRGHDAFVNSVAFSPDGKTLASGSDDDSIILWDIERGQPLDAPLRRHAESVEGSILSVAFGPDGRMLASGTDDGQVVFWDVQRRRLLGAPVTGPGGDDLETIGFSPDGKTLASGSGGGTITLWDTATRRPLGPPLTTLGGWGGLAFSRDGKTLFTGSHDDFISAWDVGLAAWKREACALANRNLTKGEWNQFIGSVRPYERTCRTLPGA